jgi:AcrR family transcriptional regulator
MARVKRIDDTPVAQLLYDAALELFAIYGYEGTTMRQIAAKAGVSAGQITFHYSTKEALFSLILHDIADYTLDYFGPMADEVAEKKKKGKLTQRMAMKYLDSIIDAQIRYVLDPGNYYRLKMVFVERMENPQEHAELVGTIVEFIESQFAELLIAASGNKIDYWKSRTVSRAINGSIVSFGEHPEFLLSSLASPSDRIRIELCLRDVARSMVKAAIGSSKG